MTARPVAAAYTLTGIGVSRGCAIGQALLLRRDKPEISEYTVPVEQRSAEVARYQQALVSARQQLDAVRSRLMAVAANGNADDVCALLDSHILMLEDSSLRMTPCELIRSDGYNAEWALKIQHERLVGVFEAMEDPYLRARQHDISQVIARLQRLLLTRETEPGPAANPGSATAAGGGSNQSLAKRIVIADDLTPADTIMLQYRGVQAFVTEHGGPLSHTAILARSLGIPAVVGVQHARRRIGDGESIIVDGESGVVVVSPGAAELSRYRGKQNDECRRREALGNLTEEPAVTRDNVPIDLYANIELPEDTLAAQRVCAAGVGLFRTEFLYMNRTDVPDEDEHLAAYADVIHALDGRPITIRTLDLGADKQVDSGQGQDQVHSTMPNNPALGLRAIRLCLRDHALFRPQLRAILRASALGPVRMMIPMVSNTHELSQVFDLVEQTKQELRQRGLAFDTALPLGGMIEVPAAAVCAGYFARQLDFLSIGTNDLIQYALAIDRTDNEVNYLYDPLHPAVLQLIHSTLRAGRQAGIPVSLCGEMASDARYTRLLLGLGLTQFSAHPNSLLEVKQAINDSRIDALRADAERLLEVNDTVELKELLARLGCMVTPA